MATRVVTDQEYAVLSDRWGNTEDFAGESLADFRKVNELVAGLPGDESAHIARRVSDGAYGILIGGPETRHDGTETARDGEPPLPSLEEALAASIAKADEVGVAFPGLDLSVAHGTYVYMGRVEVCAFVPEGDPLWDRIDEISTALGNDVGNAPKP